MAVDFREGDGLPPSELLKDDDNLSGNRNIPRKAPGRESMIVDIGSSVSSSLSSLSSPFGSEFGSTETESDEDDDDFIAELTRQMANYMLEEDDEKDSGKCGSEDLKPPSGSTVLAQYTVSGSGDEGLDSGLSSPTSVPAQAYPVFPEDQTRTIQLYKLENQPTVENQGSASWAKQAGRAELIQQPEQKHQVQYQKPNKSRRRRSDAAGGFSQTAAPWQRRQQQAGPGSGMRAVFLGAPSSRSGSAGTGVFLPRCTSNPPEGRKKRGCSTVLIPARVMQALQLHFEDMHRSRSSTRLGSQDPHPLQSDAATSRSDDACAPKNQASPPSPNPEANPNEMGLPQEWTY
ncbi:hypothetical protein NMG60_11034127 [Bertholletia excelsa]